MASDAPLSARMRTAADHLGIACALLEPEADLESRDLLRYGLGETLAVLFRRSVWLRTEAGHLESEEATRGA